MIAVAFFAIIVGILVIFYAHDRRARLTLLEPAPPIATPDPLTYHELEAMTRGYAEAAIFADCLPYATKYPYFERGVSDLEPNEELMAQARVSCLRFANQTQNRADLREYTNAHWPRGYLGAWELAGHDLWLTMHGHGSGFCARDLDELGDRLTSAAEHHAEAYGDQYPVDMGDGTAGVL